MFRSSLSIADHLDRIDRADLSVAEYAKRNGVNPWSLYKLRYLRRKKGSRTMCASSRGSSQSAALTFTQITPPSPIAFRTADIQLAFPDGIRAILPRGFDAADLRNLVSVLSVTRTAGAVC